MKYFRGIWGLFNRSVIALAVLTTLVSAPADSLVPLGGSNAVSSLYLVPQSGFSATGTWTEGQLVTISGPTASLGTIGPQLVYYKNFANEVSGNQLANGPDYIASSLVTAGPNGNGYPYVVSGSGLPYGLGMIVSNDSRIGTVTSGAGWGGINLVFGSVTAELFTSQTFYFPSSCNYSSLVSSGSPQLKTAWAYAGTISNNYLYAKICNSSISLADAVDTNASVLNQAFGSNTAFAWGSGPAIKQGAPILEMRWIQLNAAAGSGTGNVLQIIGYDGTAQTINSSLSNPVLVAGGQTVGYDHLNFPGFVQYTTGTNPNWNFQNNAYIVESEIYAAIGSSGNQGAAARVELGDAATYTACTRLAKLTIESPSWWTNSAGTTSVQARVHGGVFYQSLLHTYVYVTNSSNATYLAGQLQ
jgi:hypothetical protein